MPQFREGGGVKLCFIYCHGQFSWMDLRHLRHTQKFGRYTPLYLPLAPLGLGLHSAENLQYQHGIFTKMEAIGMMLKAAESWDGSMAGAGHF